MINQKYKIRSSIIFLFFCILYTMIIFNLYLIQIRHANFYIQLGNQQYLVTISKLPPRAPIYDRTGTHPLAINQDCVSAFILPAKLESPNMLKPFLQEHFPETYTQLEQHPHKQFMYIKRKLTPDQQKLLADHAIPDIRLLNEPHRFYPLDAAASLVGITDIDNNGLMGIEYICNKTLAGTPDTFCLEKDARSGLFYFKKETKITGEHGTPVRLTINNDLQFLVHEAVKNTVQHYESVEGAAIVMDPDNGEILAMVSYPHFDPNNTEQLNLEFTKNRVITEAYELGSVFKIFAALAALEENVTSPDEIIDCKNTRTTYVDGRKINTPREHGEIPFKDVVGFSNNIGIAIVAKRLNEKLYDHYTKLGFGNKTGIQLPGEHKGFVNPPGNWSKQSIISLSYGYEVSATLLQLATAMCVIANGGYKIIPQIILPYDKVTKEHPLYSPENLVTIKNILEHTAQKGTTKRTQIPGYRIMSKTGTANMLINGEYDTNKNLFTCAGIIDQGTYKRVIVTFIKQANRTNIFASTVAAPLFKTIAQHTIIQDRII
ncbi:MAG TPA: penicillin-binding protein 2 [Candidatus Dependentiae bacterium]|nr:penicillin-binding protein 2 [Candidatus Dependentiae bacterium]HRQ63217.1 penicillin-binding protein 2 [Candidatus Dependentiae bacterium]